MPRAFRPSQRCHRQDLESCRPKRCQADRSQTDTNRQQWVTTTFRTSAAPQALQVSVLQALPSQNSLGGSPRSDPGA